MLNVKYYVLTLVNFSYLNETFYLRYEKVFFPIGFVHVCDGACAAEWPVYNNDTRVCMPKLHK